MMLPGRCENGSDGCSVCWATHDGWNGRIVHWARECRVCDYNESIAEKDLADETFVR